MHKLADIDAERRVKFPKIEQTEKSWEIVNKDTVDFKFPCVFDADAFALLKYRGPKLLCNIFLDFITTDLIRAIWVNGEVCMGGDLYQGRDWVVVVLTRSSCCSIFVAISIFREMKGVQMSDLLNFESLGQLFSKRLTILSLDFQAIMSRL